MKHKSLRILLLPLLFAVVGACLTRTINEESFSSIVMLKQDAPLSIDNKQSAQILSFEHSDKTMYINSNAVIVREQPNDESDIISSLDYADYIQVTGDNKNESYGWAQVKIGDTTGYIDSAYLSEDMLFFDTSSDMFINQDFTSDEGIAFPRNLAVTVNGYNNDYSRIVCDGQVYIIPSAMLSSSEQPDPIESINYNYITADRYIPVVEKAYSLIGTPYGHGYSESLTDCVGLTMMCYSTIGVDLPWSLDQAYCGTSVSYSNIVPGDIIIWAPLGSSRVSHVGIYVGEGKMIHASSTCGVTTADVENYMIYGGNMLDVRHID